MRTCKHAGIIPHGCIHACMHATAMHHHTQPCAVSRAHCPIVAHAGTHHDLRNVADASCQADMARACGSMHAATHTRIHIGERTLRNQCLRMHAGAQNAAIELTYPCTHVCVHAATRARTHVFAQTECDNADGSIQYRRERRI